MRTSDGGASTVWDARKGDGEGGGSMEELGLGGEVEEEEARVTEEEEGGLVAVDEAARSLRAAFFFLRRTFRSWVEERPWPGGTGG